MLICLASKTMGRTRWLAAAWLLAPLPPATRGAGLVFYSHTDIVGFASMFEEGMGLPTTDLTMSVAARGSSGRGQYQPVMSDWAFHLSMSPLQDAISLTFDQTSYFFPINSSASVFEALVIRTATWTVAYENATRALSLWTDGTLLGSHELSALPFDGRALFGPDAIQTFYFGGYAAYADGVLSESPDETRGLYGEIQSFRVWNRALNESEIALMVTAHNSTTASDACIDLRFDRGYGTRVANQGSSGSAYDAVLGEYASGVSQMSTQLGSDCGGYENPCTHTTLPVWVNKTDGKNRSPLANNAATSLIESAMAVSTSAVFYFTGSDADGDLLDFAVTRLPAHGALELKSGLDPSAAPIAITVTPFFCWDFFSRYSMVWHPDTDSNEPVSIGFKAWDGTAFSTEASVEFTIEPIDGVPTVVASEYDVAEDDTVLIALSHEDTDSVFTSVFITRLPSNGRLFVVDAHGNRNQEIVDRYSEWETSEPFEQYATSVLAVSTFWPASGAGNGYPSWHPYQIMGEQDAANMYGDSILAFCPSTLQGTTDAIQSGGDDYITFSYNTWQSYLEHGFTEFIEIGYDQSVFVHSVTTGENRGVGSVVGVKAWDNETQAWQILYTGEANVEASEYHKRTTQYFTCMPPICQTAFKSSIIRLEMDTYAIPDWNEIDYVKLVGSTTAKSGVLHTTSNYAVRVIYMPDSNFAGTDSFAFAGCDCAYYSSRTSDNAEVKVSVGAVNDALVASDLSYEMECGAESSTVHLVADNVDSGDNHIFTLESLPSLLNLYDGGMKITAVPTILSGDRVSLSLNAVDGDVFPPSFDFDFHTTDQSGLTSNSAKAQVTCTLLTCAAAKYFDIGDARCADCPAGTAELEPGMRSTCSPCSPGYSQSAVGQIACSLCEPGKVATKRGLTKCIPCPTGSTCPEGREVVLKPGYWGAGVDLCPYGVDACSGGVTDGRCGRGYTGVLCAVCEPGFVLRFDQCHDCSSVSRTGTMLIFAFALGIALVVALLRRTSGAAFGAAMESISVMVPIRIDFATCQVPLRLHNGKAMKLMRMLQLYRS